MILSPIQNTAYQLLGGEWKQKRPRITQKFGENPQMYEPMGMKAHNGTDFGIPVGTPLFAPCDGHVKVRTSKNGYGVHIKLRSPHKAIECVLGHMSEITVLDGAYVHTGDLIGYSGNTGFSTGPHLHFGMRRLRKSQKNIWDWAVEDYNNGYYGYVDSDPYTITWKGSLTKNTI